MAKSSKTRKANSKPKGKVKRSQGIPRAPRGDGMTDFQHLLNDPCNGPLTTAYGGSRGYVTRFSQDVTFNAATQTAGYIAYFPGQETFLSQGAVTSSTLVSAGTAFGPGQNFLALNASQVRCIAACITIIPSAVSANNITGELGTSSITWNGIANGNSYTVDGFMQLCTTRAVLSKRSYEAKWFPGDSDSQYSSQVAAGSALPPDTNVNGILLCYKGYPAGTALSARLTAVIEWLPAQNLGVPAPTLPSASQNPTAQAAALHKANPDWWHNFGDFASQFVGGVGRTVANAGRQLLNSGLRSAISYGSKAGMLALL